MTAFQMTPDGIREVSDEPQAMQQQGFIPATVSNVVPPKPEPQQSLPGIPAPSAPHKAEKPPAPKDIIKMARARVRDIKRELKRMRKLETELQQLQRLIDAADGKTLAPVRAINQARKGA